MDSLGGIAIVIALVSLGVSIHSALSSRRSSRAAERSADEAAKGNDINRRTLGLQEQVQKDSLLPELVIRLERLGNRTSTCLLNIGQRTAHNVKLTATVAEGISDGMERGNIEELAKLINERWGKGNRSLEPRQPNELGGSHYILRYLRVRAEFKDAEGSPEKSPEDVPNIIQA